MPVVPLSSQFYKETQGLNTNNHNIERKSFVIAGGTGEET
jgi:hypothetical protein